ncbi:MAG TPA: hypothetical protein VEL05_11750 [Candidatus Acidoferrum sp.]|nr:hypothetical protein [Candidatus Acidoferrum sp.]
MKLTYEGADQSANLEARVRDWAAELDTVYDRIDRCDVVVAALPARQRVEKKYRVRLAIAVPGGEIVVSRDPGPGPGPDDPTSAVRDSFRAARRRLQQYVWRNLGEDLGAPEKPVRSG